MLTETLNKLFTRDLKKLGTEISLYKNEDALWTIRPDILNSAGNLALHLIGNLNAYIGAELGKTGYIRQRDLEFSLKNIPKDDLIRMVDDTIIVVNNVLTEITDESLDKTYPIIVFAEAMTTEFFLIHLLAHLNYHLGQINYHRRLMEGGV